MTTERYYTIDSDALIKKLIEDGYIEHLGTGDRYDDNSGLHDDYFKGDNTYNWEIVDEDEDENESAPVKKFYSLSNNFEIKQHERILVLSKHIGVDIRGGYEDDILYLITKNYEDYNFYLLIDEVKGELAKEDQ